MQCQMVAMVTFLSLSLDSAMLHIKFSKSLKLLRKLTCLVILRLSVYRQAWATKCGVQVARGVAPYCRAAENRDAAGAYVVIGREGKEDGTRQSK